MVASAEPIAPKPPIRVAFVSIFYPVFMGRYLLDALLRRPDVEVWTAGPYTGRWIPWAGGMNLPEHYVFRPDRPMPAGSPPSAPYPLLESECPFKPDLWLEVNSALRTIGRPRNAPYVIVGTDPHVLNYAPQRAMADAFFCMQKPYMERKDHWLPYAYDPIYHAQTTVPAADRQWDAALLGLQYGTRQGLVQALRGSGLKVNFQLGPAYADARDIYHQTRVGLNWSSLMDTTARCFELMAFGIAPVMNRVPDLMELFKDGEHFEGFDNMRQGHDKVVALARDPERCEALGRAARLAVEPHTWDARIETILREMGLL